MRAPRAAAPAALLIALAGLGPLAGCRETTETAGPPPRHLVLISLDTFRADALGKPGRGGASLTPGLDRFAADAVRVDGAQAPMAFTLPSHMSMFTGLHPGVHGVVSEKARLPASAPLLAEALRAAGWRTVGLMTNEWLKADFGFGRGFDRYEQIAHRLTYADRVAAEGLAELERAERDGKPLFLFLHFMDPHSDFRWGENRLPYFAPDPFLDGLVRGQDDPRFCDAEDRCATDFLIAADRERRTLGDEELAGLRGLYEAGLAYLDRDLAGFFAALRERGLYDRTAIVVVSDHGEEFREHGMLLHSQVYEESLGVPLLVKFAGARHAGTRLRALVEVQDLMPTLLELAEVPVPAGLQGVSLLPLLTSGGETGRDPRRAAVGQDKLVRSRYSLRTSRFKLVHDFADGSEALYDLAADPGERHDVAAALPEKARRLRVRLEQALRDHRRSARELVAAAVVPGTDVLSAEERERLKSLGYLNN